MQEVSLFAAFVAGILSFISPCVLPLIPGYLSFVSGVTLEEMRGTGAAATLTSGHAKRRAVIMSLAFVLGFSIVFISLGASATAIGTLLMEHMQLLGKIAGVVIILFGLHMMGVLKIGWLYSEKRVQTNRKPAGFFGAMLVGIAFAFGWTPCIGPILSAILLVASAQETVGEGVTAAGGVLGGTRRAVHRDGVRHQPVPRCVCAHPQALSRHRSRLWRPDGGRRRADLHRQVHSDRATPHAVPANVLIF